MKSIVFCLFIFSGLIWLQACAIFPGPVCEYEGENYCRTRGRFTGRWHDYYKRAVSCMEGGCYEAAVSDLDEALKRRPGENRWVNTYGMHFMDYFPHREKGISHYFMGDYHAAESELVLSIQREPSDKARFYLDKVRRRIMEEEKQAPDIPELRIIHPQISKHGSDERRTRDEPVIISGWAADKQYVSEIILAGRRVFNEGSKQRVKFRESLNLPPGRHEIPVLVRNLLGGERKETLMICVDRSGPMIFTEDARDLQIKGRVYDEAGLRSLVIEADGERSEIPTEENGAFVISLPPDMMNASLRATDALGNETRADLAVSPLTRYRPLQGIFAQNASDIYALNPHNRPEILLKGWPNPEPVFRKSVDIEGEVFSNQNLEEVSIEIAPGEDRISLRIPDFRADTSGFFFHFNQSVSLDAGENRVIIKVRDRSGRTERKSFPIIRKIPGVLIPENRYAFKMYPFDETDEWKQDTDFLGGLFSNLPIYWRGYEFMKPETRAWFQLFLSENFDIRPRFQVLFHRHLKQLFKEYRFSRNHTTPPVRCHALFLADTYEDRKGVEVIARLVDIRTSEIIAVKDVYGQSRDKASLKAMARRLSEKFHRAFPLTCGMIFNISQKSLKADFNQNKITEGWPMIVYRENEQRYNPVTGKSLGADTKILVDALMGKDNNIKTIGDGKILKPGDKIITR